MNKVAHIVGLHGLVDVYGHDKGEMNKAVYRQASLGIHGQGGRIERHLWHALQIGMKLDIISVLLQDLGGGE